MRWLGQSLAHSARWVMKAILEAKVHWVKIISLTGHLPGANTTVIQMLIQILMNLVRLLGPHLLTKLFLFGAENYAGCWQAGSRALPVPLLAA